MWCARLLEKVPSAMLSLEIARGSFKRAEKREAVRQVDP